MNSEFRVPKKHSTEAVVAPEYRGTEAPKHSVNRSPPMPKAQAATVNPKGPRLSSEARPAGQLAQLLVVAEGPKEGT